VNNQTKPIPQFSEKLWLGIVFLALVIRVLDGVRIPLYMDELPVLYNVAHFLKNKTLLPSHFNYPTLFSYLIVSPVLVVFLGYYIFSGFPISGLLNSQWISLLFSSNLPLLVWAGRSVSILFSISTIIFVYFYSRKKYGLLPALVSASILCVDPLGGRYITFSRLSLPDVAAAFFVTGCVIQGLIFLEKKKLKWLIGSALTAGLAVSTKYNAGLVVIPLLYLCFVHREQGYWKRLIWIPAMVLVGFLAGSPGWILNTQKFLQGYLFEAAHMQAGHLGQFGQDWVWVIQYLWSCKTIMLPMIMITMGISMIRHRKEDIVLLLLVIPAFIVIGRFEKKSIHYFLFLYPVLALFIGRMISVIEKKYFQNRIKWIFILSFVILFFIQPLYRLIPKIKRDFTTRSSVIAEKWIAENISYGSVIVLDRLILVNLLDIKETDEQIQTMKSSNNKMWQDGERFYQKRPRYNLMPVQKYWHDIDAFIKMDIPYVVISSYNYGRFFNKNKKPPGEWSPLYHDFINKKSFYSYFIFKKDKVYRQLIRLKSKAGLQIRIYQRIP